MNAIPLPYKLLAVLLVLAALVGMGYRAGVRSTEARYADTALVDARQYAAAITKAENDARAAKDRSAKLLAAADADYQTQLAQVNDHAQKTIADLRAGRVQLRIPSCPAAPGGNAVPETATGTGQPDGQTRSDVLAGLSEYLVDRFGQCDAIVEQLTGAQAVIEADRK